MPGTGLPDSPSQTPGGTAPADTLSLDFWPPDCEAVNFYHLSHQFVGLCQQPQDTLTMCHPAIAARAGSRSSTDSPASEGPGHWLALLPNDWSDVLSKEDLTQKGRNVNNNTNRATLNRSQSCPPRGTMLHVLCLRPLGC